VRLVMAASMRSGSMFAVLGSISTKTGRAPVYEIASAVAMNVLAVLQDEAEYYAVM
jgi:hypothetical protein